MKEILKEILYELKEIRKEIRAVGGNSNPVEVKIIKGEDVLAEKVVDVINKTSRLSKDAFVRKSI